MNMMMTMKMIDKYEDDEDYVFVGDDGGAGDVWLLGTDNDDNNDEDDDDKYEDDEDYVFVGECGGWLRQP